MEEFKVSILTAERPFFEGCCDSLTVPLEDGEFGILAHHCDLIAAVVPGMVRYRPAGGEEHIASVDAGMVKIENGSVLLLVDSAEHPEEIDERRAQRALAAAKEAALQKQSYREYKMTQASLARAVSRLKVKNRQQDIK